MDERPCLLWPLPSAKDTGHHPREFFGGFREILEQDVKNCFGSSLGIFCLTICEAHFTKNRRRTILNHNIIVSQRGADRARPHRMGWGSWTSLSQTPVSQLVPPRPPIIFLFTYNPPSEQFSAFILNLLLFITLQIIGMHYCIHVLLKIVKPTQKEKKAGVHLKLSCKNIFHISLCIKDAYSLLFSLKCKLA